MGLLQMASEDNRPILFLGSRSLIYEYILP